MQRFAFLLLVLAINPATADEIGKAKRIVFLGDSNTFAGKFIALLDADLITRDPERKVELINLGLPSETVSGLSEADHPYPRPNVHTRLAVALRKSKPDIVVACYGMNDGIYSPFDEGRFEKYQSGIQKLVADCEKAGAKVILMTPAPFDPVPLQGKVLPKGAEKYSWMKPYAEYDDVLTRYSKWLLEYRDKGYLVADPHAALHEHLSAKRKSNPKYFVSGDGIHPNADGHAIIYRELAAALKLINAAEMKSVEVTAGTTFEWSSRPVTPSVLRIPKLKAGDYSLFEGDQLLGSATAEQWQAGVDLSKWTQLSSNAVRSALAQTLDEKTRMLGLAWLTDVGHQRPDTPKGIALVDAQAKAAELDAKARAMAKPVTVKLTLKEKR